MLGKQLLLLKLGILQGILLGILLCWWWRWLLPLRSKCLLLHDFSSSFSLHKIAADTAQVSGCLLDPLVALDAFLEGL